jgi:hypothetical protein
MRKNYWRAFLTLLTAAIILGACSSLAAESSAPVIPGLAQTLAAETLTALDVNQPKAAATQSPAQDASQIKVFENLTTPTPELIVSPSMHDGEKTPAPEVINPEATPKCTNLAEFVKDVTFPDDSNVDPNQRFTKTWEFKNAGTCTWTPEYAIVFMWGASMNCPTRVPIENTVPPGETLTISVPLVAPDLPSDYQGNWLFEDNHGVRFGIGYKGRQFFWVSVSVGGGGNGEGGLGGGCLSGG